MTNPSPRAPKRSQRPSAVISLVAVITATVLGFVGAITAFVTEKQETSRFISVEELMRLESTIQSNRQKIDSLEEHLREATTNSQLPRNGSGNAALAHNVSQLDTRMEQIENWIVLKPAQAVAIPLLKQEIQELSRTVSGHLQHTTREFERIYSIGQWFIGTLVALIIGLVVPLVANILGTRRRHADEPGNGNTPEPSA